MQSDDPLAHSPLVEQAYWDTAYDTMPPGIAATDDPVRRWLEASIPQTSGTQHCLEVGCYPGRYLAVLARSGYVVHGVDLTPAIARMPSAFAAEGYQVGRFEQVDFLAHQFDRTYDLVCSFGFIEHFTQWREVLAKHAELVAPGGLLVVETPNFRGWVQQLFHRWIDGINTRRHHLPAMAPETWAAIARTQGFEVIQAGYLGRFDLWTDTPVTTWWQRMGYRFLALTTPLWKRFGSGRAATAPYCILIARRIGPGQSR